MKHLAFVALAVMLIVGCSASPNMREHSVARPTGVAPDRSVRDHLVGWYKMPGSRGTTIPIFKIDGTYYSVCFGAEIPLKECPEGLEWAALKPSSMTGTRIGFDEQTNDYYIVIQDRLRAAMSEETRESVRKLGFSLGEKTAISRIDTPSGLLDATAKPPSTNGDFLGWYEAVWLPIRFEIRRDGETLEGARPSG